MATDIAPISFNIDAARVYVSVPGALLLKAFGNCACSDGWSTSTQHEPSGGTCGRCRRLAEYLALGHIVAQYAACQDVDGVRIASHEHGQAPGPPLPSDELEATRKLLIEANEKCRRLSCEMEERVAMLQQSYDDAMSTLRTTSANQLRDCQARHDEDIRRVRDNFCSMLTRYEEQLTKFLENCDMTSATNRITDSIFALRDQQSTLQQLTVQQLQTLHAEIVQRDKLQRDAIYVQLKDELERLKAENEKLKNTNHVKGTMGENLVRGILQEQFPHWTFIDTSAMGAHSDFHMVCPQSGATIAVEVKNKALVTNGDVDKSIRDALELKDRLANKLVAYVFVSIRTRNIPKRGPLNVELLDRIPMLWYGTADEEELCGSGMELSKLLKLVYNLGAAISDKQKDVAAANSIVQRARTYLDRLQKQRKMVTNMHNALASMKKVMNDLLEEVDSMYRDIELTLMNPAADGATSSESHELPHELSHETSHEPSHEDTTTDAATVIRPDMIPPVGATQCSGCGRTYKNIKLHLRTCGKGSSS